MGCGFCMVFMSSGVYQELVVMEHPYFASRT
jgi:hypothetical protein